MDDIQTLFDSDEAENEYMQEIAKQAASKRILDVTCSTRSIWFNKNNPAALYCDCRYEEHEETFGNPPRLRHTVVHPDIICNFTNLPFSDNSFNLVVFDPPHRYGLKDSWFLKRYGTYETKEEMLDTITKGFHECMRVLEPNGVLVFKWSEIQISTSDIISAFGVDPLFGHRSGKKMGTHWLCFMKGV